MDENKKYSRQLDFVKPSELDIPIWIIGAGGIGSWTTLALSKMGCNNLVVFDHDKVELHNTPSQLYTSDQIGQMKTAALKETILKLTGQNIISVSTKFEDWDIQQTVNPKIIINAVDSLEARRSIWAMLKNVKPMPFDVFIDARMAGEFLRILCVSPLNDYSLNQYEKGLNSIVKPHEEICTARSIVYNVFSCAGIIANYVKRYVKGEPIEPQTQLDLSVMQFI